MRTSYALSFTVLTLLFIGCAGQPLPTVQPPSANQPKEDTGGITLTSTAFKEGQPIPSTYTCDGVNVSPPLEWSGIPKSAKTIAVIAEDPDTPNGTWVHWVLFNLPAENIGLVENLPATESLKAGGFQGTNDFGKIGYGGPCPPSGTHRYFFKIYALDAELSLKGGTTTKDGATKQDLEKAMTGHIVSQAQLMGTYKR
jgi:Raf kinase inhibitor-like YbhB/YbcL family protein